jgi:SAM-dependent methyltransferase
MKKDDKARIRPDEWTSRYFGKLYGELYSRFLLTPAQTRKEAEFARQVLRLDGKRVLDLACGFGRHARLLVRHAHVVGLDRNAEYLAMAREGIPRRWAARFAAVRADMRRLPLRPEAFDAVVLLFNSFGYFVPPPPTEAAAHQPEVWKLPRVFYERGLVDESFGIRVTREGARPERAAAADDENLLVLEEIARVLAPRGQLLLEAPNPRPLIEAVLAAPRRWLITRQYEIEEEFTYDRLRRVLSNHSRFTMGGRTETAEYHLHLYSRVQLARALKAAGLEVQAVYGSYEGEPYSAPDSSCILFVAQKRPARTAGSSRGRAAARASRGSAAGSGA